jgi:hypothetical protein
MLHWRSAACNLNDYLSTSSLLASSFEQLMVVVTDSASDWTPTGADGRATCVSKNVG